MLNDRYVIEGFLGAGGAAEVYRGLDRRLGRKVAIKMVDPFRSSVPLAEARFVREAQSMAELDSPYLVPVFDLGSDGSRLYMVEKLLEGTTLADSRCHSALQAVTWVCDTLRALEVLHAGDIVHRDVKPSNVFVHRGRDAVLLDLGLALHLGEKRLTDRTVVLGTPAFMAPEHALGHEVSTRTDLYAAGLVLLAMLNGRNGDELPTTSVQDRIVGDAWLRPRLAGLPAPLRRVLRVAVARDPARRYASATLMREALAAVPAHELAAIPAGVASSGDADTSTVPARPASTARRGIPEVGTGPAAAVCSMPALTRAPDDDDDELGAR